MYILENIYASDSGKNLRFLHFPYGKKPLVKRLFLWALQKKQSSLFYREAIKREKSRNLRFPARYGAALSFLRYSTSSSGMR